MSCSTFSGATAGSCELYSNFTFYNKLSKDMNNR